MAGIEAPFQTATELTGQPAEAALGGVQQNFDPANKDPLHALQEAQVRLDTEAAARLQQQRQFEQQRQQQFREQQHDILTKHMAYDHEDKVLKANQALKDRQDLFNMFNQTGGTSATLKDEQGNDMSIPLLPQDQKQLDEATNSFQKIVMADPTGYKNNPDLWAQMNDLKHQRTNASMRSIYLRQAQQQLQSTYDPAEQEKLRGYMEKIQSTPLDEKNPPMPYIQQAQVKPVLDLAKYKEGKGFESFDDGSGIPNAEYQKLLTTTNPNDINEGFKRFQFFQQQPQGQSAAAYKDYQDHLNELTDARGLPRIELGGVPTADGKILFDADTYAKKQALAKNYLAATELLNSGHLKNPDEEDVLKSEKTKAEIRKDKAEAAIKEKELATGKSAKPTTEELKQEQDKKSVESTYHEVRNVFKSSIEDKKPVTPLYPAYWERRGVNPKEYEIYPEIKGKTADKFVGVPHPETSTTVTNKTTGDKTTSKSTTVSEVPDKVVPIRNKSTGTKELLYMKGGEVIARVPERQAVINGLKHESDYDPKIYENKTAWVDDVVKNGVSSSNNKKTPSTNAAPVQKKIGGVTYEKDSNGKWFKIL